MRVKEFLLRIGVRKHTLRDYFLVIVGASVQAFGMRLFLIPAQLVSGGVSGAAQIIHFFSGFPIGLLVIIGNIPLYLIGWRHLGGLKFALRTLFAVLVFSLLTDLLPYVLPIQSITHDILLNTLYGAVLLGAGLGLVYLGRGTSGGSDILGRILNYRFGFSISAAYMLTDSLVVLASGFAFGWEKALYGLIVIYMSGLVAEMVSEGSSVVRTALVITEKPDEIAAEVMEELERGVTYLYGKGAYTGNDRTILYCVVSRPEVSIIKGIISEIDPEAFVVIGQANEALGEGFRPLLKK
ncbi:MAG TPA: YitT family protein [Anaerolineaceae bacterium]|nr:YitT family protein [Anaerolineaceae bacterium]